MLMLAACSSSKKGKHETAGTVSPSLQKKYAAILEVSPRDVMNTVLYGFVDKWMSTAYSYGGQSEKGIDCSGFTQKLYDAVYKTKLPRTSDDQYKALKQHHTKKQLEEGDLVFFTTVKGKKISHVGVYLQNNRFVNATNSGVAISDMTTKYWAERYVGGGSP
jgi:cell wall-associated NlpC family hydrolase